MLQTNFEASYPSAGFELVHIDVDNLFDVALHNHWDQYSPTFPVLTGCASLYGQYGSGYIPYNVVLDPAGVVRYTYHGFEEDALHAIINQYLLLDFPLFTIQELIVTDEGNGDGRPDGGETILLDLSLRNSPNSVPSTGATVTMTCDDPEVTILDGTVAYPAADPGEVIFGSSVFSFSVADSITPHWATFTFRYMTDYSGGTAEGDLTHLQRMGRPDLLLVDSDGGMDDNETFVQSALNAMGEEYDFWGPMDPPLSDVLSHYDRLIWLGGVNEDDMSNAEETAIRDFVAAGGQLLLSSQYLSDNPARADLMLDLFGLILLDNDAGSVYQLACPAADPYFGSSAMLVTGNQAANNNEEPDSFTSNGTATTFATWNQNPAMGHVAGVYTTATGVKAMFCGFPIEANRVHAALPGSMTVQGFLERAFDYLGPIINPPEAVTDLSIQVRGDMRVELTWSAAISATRYRVEQRMTGRPWLSVAETTETHWVGGPALGESLYRVISLGP